MACREYWYDTRATEVFTRVRCDTARHSDATGTIRLAGALEPVGAGVYLAQMNVVRRVSSNTWRAQLQTPRHRACREG